MFVFGNRHYCRSSNGWNRIWNPNGQSEAGTKTVFEPLLFGARKWTIQPKEWVIWWKMEIFSSFNKRFREARASQALGRSEKMVDMYMVYVGKRETEWEKRVAALHVMLFHIHRLHFRSCLMYIFGARQELWGMPLATMGSNKAQCKKYIQ